MSAGSRGSIAKHRQSPYLPGRRAATWLKIKIRPEQELVVVGWTTGIGYATELAALLVAVNERGSLRYVGKVGAGFNQDSGWSWSSGSRHSQR